MSAILLDGLWQGALIVAVAYASTTLLRRNDAATRYAIWFSALIALAVVPPLTLWHPFEQLPAAAPIRFASGPARVATNAADLAGMWIAALWFAGSALCFFRLGWSFVRIRAILRDASAAPQFGSDVVLSGAIAIPIAAGLRRPQIVLPASLPELLDAADLQSVIAHERAHIRGARSEAIRDLLP